MVISQKRILNIRAFQENHIKNVAKYSKIIKKNIIKLNLQIKIKVRNE